MDPLLISICAEGGVPCADLSALLWAGNFLLEVPDVSAEFLNESLAALVKKLSGDIKNLEREISRLNKGGQVSARNTTLCKNCKKGGFHHPEA